MAWKHYHAGHLQQAAQLCGQVVKADSRHVGALYLLGLIAARTGRDDLAIGYLERSCGSSPISPTAHSILGNVGIRQGKLPEAVASFREAVRARPDSPWRMATWAMP